MAKTNEDTVGDKCVRSDASGQTFDDNAKKKAWKSYYSQVLNTLLSLKFAQSEIRAVVGCAKLKPREFQIARKGQNKTKEKITQIVYLL